VINLQVASRSRIRKAILRNGMLSNRCIRRDARVCHPLGNRIAILAPGVGQEALMAAAGVVVGAAGGYALASLAGSYIHGMQMPGALPVAGSAALLLAAALVASLLLAARRMDVM